MTVTRGPCAQSPAMKPSSTLLLIFLVAVVVFAQTLWGGFVWDDLMLIQFNARLHESDALLKSLTWNFWECSSPTGATASYWRPLPKLSHVVLYRLGNEQPWLFHGFNVVMHALNSVLVAVWARKRLLATGVTEVSGVAALAAGVVFALHPSRYEVVGWISCSTELIFAFFALLVAIAFEKRAWWGVLAMFGAVFSKETALVLPVLFGLDAFLRKELRTRLPWIAATGVVVGIAWVLRWVLHFEMPPVNTATDLVVIASRSLGAFTLFHLRSLLPTEVTIIASEFEPVGPGRFDIPAHLIVIGVALVIAWGTLIVTGLRKQSVRPWLADALWWLIPLGPVLQVRLVPAPLLVSDRFLYLPIAGAAVLVARAFSKLPERHVRAARLGLAGWATAAAVMLSLALPSYVDNHTFFAREFSLHPGHLFAAEGYGRALDASGNFWAAQKVFQTRLERGVPEHRRLELLSVMASTYHRTLRDDQVRELTQLASYFSGIVNNNPKSLQLGDREWELSPRAAAETNLMNSQDGLYFRELRADLLSRLGQQEEILKVVARRRRREPGAESTLDLARRLAIADKWMEALVVLDEDTPRYRELERSPLARFIRTSSTLAPQVPETAASFAVRRAAVYARLGAPWRARRELEPFITTDAADPRLVHARVQVEISDLNYERALEILDEAIARQPGETSFADARREVTAAQDLWKRAVEVELMAAEPATM